MQIVTDPTASVPPAGGSAVTIGAYDGVHIGHQALLADLSARAERRGLATVVVTFDRHPATVVRPDSAPLLLCDLAQKLELLAAAGVDRTVVLPFDEERANESAEDFVTEILIGAVASKLVVVGEDFHFGHGRKGNVALLREMGVDGGFTVEGMSLTTAGDAGLGTAPISSTRIRSLVADGRVADAALLLGRPHQVRGVVEHGDARGGADLGFPTANVEVPAGIALPAVGIYAGWYERPDGTRWAAAISVGTRPTFYGDEGSLMVEAFLLDFEGDLYGEEARVSFVDQVRRDELRFDSVDELVAQMHRDVDATRSALAGG
ncbi:MAG TPA: bifunctional riboflavin kinase/FAD synthetase [Acidimicrobiales bacterium]